MNIDLHQGTSDQLNSDVAIVKFLEYLDALYQQQPFLATSLIAELYTPRSMESLGNYIDTLCAQLIDIEETDLLTIKDLTFLFNLFHPILVYIEQIGLSKIPGLLRENASYYPYLAFNEPTKVNPHYGQNVNTAGKIQ